MAHRPWAAEEWLGLLSLLCHSASEQAAHTQFFPLKGEGRSPPRVDEGDGTLEGCPEQPIPSQPGCKHRLVLLGVRTPLPRA